MNKKRLFIVVPRLAGGGQERMAVTTAEVLKDIYDVSIVIFSEDNKAYNTEEKVINLKLPAKIGVLGKLLQQIRRSVKLRKIRRAIKPDIVYSIGNTANITNVLSRGNGRTIISLRGFANVKQGTIDKYIYEKAEAITCISAGMRNKLISLYPAIKMKTWVLYNGLDTEKIRTLALSNIPGIHLPTGFKIVAAGRLIDVKGYRHLIKSFARLKEKGLREKVSLIILGDGKNKEELIQLADQLSIGSDVHFLGFQSNLYSVMKQCDLFVLSSINEGFGNVIIEAMTCGLPIISTACLSGPAEILGANSYEINEAIRAEYGVLVPPFSSDTSSEEVKEEILAEAIYELITDNEKAKMYSEKSIKRAEAFSIHQYRNEILRIFDDVLGIEKEK